MTETPTILERAAVGILEGTPAELTAYLATAPQEIKLKLILPETVETKAATPVTPHAGMTFAEILAPAQQGFEESGMTEEELDDFIEAEIKAYRAEKRAEAQAAA